MVYSRTHYVQAIRGWRQSLVLGWVSSPSTQLRAFLISSLSFLATLEVEKEHTDQSMFDF
jgi:hypothetical protein